MILRWPKRSASGQPVPSSRSRSAHLLLPHTSTYRFPNWLAIGDGVGGNSVWRGLLALMIRKTLESMAAPPRVGHCLPHRAERRRTCRPIRHALSRAAQARTTTGIHHLGVGRLPQQRTRPFWQAHACRPPASGNRIATRGKSHHDPPPLRLT